MWACLYTYINCKLLYKWKTVFKKYEREEIKPLVRDTDGRRRHKFTFIKEKHKYEKMPTREGQKATERTIIHFFLS